MSKKLKSLLEQRSEIYTQIEQLNNSIEDRSMNEEEQARWNDLNEQYTNLSAQIEAERSFLDIQREQGRVDSQTRSNEPGEGGSDDELRAFQQFIKGGTRSLTPEQHNILSEGRAISTTSSASAFVPKEVFDRIEMALKKYGGVMSVANIVTTETGGELLVPVVDDTDEEVTIVAEGSASSEDAAQSPTSIAFHAYMLRTKILLASYELLQDSKFDIDSFISELMNGRYARGLNKLLTVGTGTSQPKGIVTAAVDSGVVPEEDSISYDDIVDLIASVDSAYGENGSFMMNYKTLLSLAKIKDDNNNPIWAKDITGKMPQTILGHPVVINNHMADIGAENVSMLFGDLSKYMVRLVADFRILRLDEKYADKCAVGFHGFGRADGNLLDAGTHPVKKLTHPEAATQQS